MYLDIRTLIACNAAIAFFMASALLFYEINYKTYSGYGFWLSSIFVLAFAYVSMMLRVFMPLWLSIVLTNATIVFVGVLRLDGVQRFTRNHKLKKIYYGLPVLTIPVCMFFYVVRDNVMLRNLFTSCIIAVLVMVVCAEFYKNRTKENKNLYTVLIYLNLIYGLLIFSRAILWFLHPGDSLFTAGIVHQLHFFVLTVLEVGLGISWLMMNNQRLEAELLASKDHLSTTVDKLEKAMSKVKTLSGIIPICMHCKEIRDDQGYWNRIEKFISQHSEAEFSHGICPKCMKEKYPELYDRMDYR